LYFIKFSDFYSPVNDGVINCIYHSDKGVQNDTAVVNNNGGDAAPSSGGYRMPLVWIDLEMTGKLHRNFFNVHFRRHTFIYLFILNSLCSFIPQND
jgi:hypothetical protein